MDETGQKFWWENDGDDAATAVFRSLETYDHYSVGLTLTNLRCLRSYMNRDTSAISVSNYLTASTQDGMSLFGNYAGRPDRAQLNVIKSAIDTLVSKLGKAKIKPSFLTTGGTLSQRTRAKDMNQFLYGHMEETHSDVQYRKALRMAGIFGTAFRKTYRQNGKIMKEIICPDEIVVDPIDAYYGCPTSVHHRKFVSKKVLAGIERFTQGDPQRKAKILATRPVQAMTVGPNAADTILAVESWHLPDKEAGIPGKHVISIRGMCLIDEEWKHPRFPFARLYYTPPVLGYWGQGLAEELFGLQSELNRLMFHAQECLRLIAHPRIFVHSASKFNPAHFVNQIGTFVPYSGDQPPVVHVPTAVGPEVFGQIESLYQKAFAQAGVSQLSSQAQKPQGLDSGKALREFSDIESERFADFQKQYEEFIVEDALVSLMMMPDDYTVSTISRQHGLKPVTWSDIKLPQDSYVLQCFPLSALPQHPAGKLQTVVELKNEGFIEPEVAAELLDFPDVDSQAQVRLAPLKLIIEQLESALLKGEYHAPEPFQPLALAIKYGNLYWNWATLNDFPEHRIELVREYVQDCLALQQLAQPVPAPVSPGQQMLESQLAAPVPQQAVPGAVLQPAVA